MHKIVDVVSWIGLKLNYVLIKKSMKKKKH